MTANSHDGFSGRDARRPPWSFPASPSPANAAVAAVVATATKAARLRELDVDAEVLAQRGLRYERLDQIMMEHLLGARG